MSLRRRLERLEALPKGRCPRCEGRPAVAVELDAHFDWTACAPDPAAAPCPGCGWRPEVVRVVSDPGFYNNHAHLGIGLVRPPQTTGPA